MELKGISCNGCGSTNVRFDEKNRLLICYQCGKEEPFSRHDFANKSNVVITKDNAMKFFSEGHFEEAHRYAQDVLNIMLDNLPALYIIAYYEEIVLKRFGYIKHFFEQAKEVVDVDYHEVRDMLHLFELTASNLIDYEKDVIEFVSYNMQAPEDKKELCDFLDKVCPYFISKRPSIDYFKNTGEYYKELAGHCGIPKTCYALIKSIMDNPDSPYKSNAFDMKQRNLYFYQNYVLKIGEIVNAMDYPDMKDKFVGMYNQIQNKYINDTN